MACAVSMKGLRVTEGLRADPECCDGTDEWATGACPDRCAEIGKEHRERTEAEAKTRKTVRGLETLEIRADWFIGLEDPGELHQMGGRGAETTRSRVERERSRGQSQRGGSGARTQSA